jgi:hypothetical protein
VRSERGINNDDDDDDDNNNNNNNNITSVMLHTIPLTSTEICRNNPALYSIFALAMFHTTCMNITIV